MIIPHFQPDFAHLIEKILYGVVQHNPVQQPQIAPVSSRDHYNVQKMLTKLFQSKCAPNEYTQVKADKNISTH
jgi:hypothetical protein